MTCVSGNCKKNCGSGKANVPPPKNKDATFVALCEILCKVRKEFCEGKHKGKKRGQVAEDQAKKSQKLKDSLGTGKSAKVNSTRRVRFPNMPKSWKRSALSPENLAKQLAQFEKQFAKAAAKKLGQKATTKLATAWARFVPVVGWGLAAYDAYDIVTTGQQIYKDWDKIKSQFTGDDIYNIRPDVAVVDENGRLTDIYDFKMDNPDSGFEDDWNDGQKEMYDKALQDDKSTSESKVVDAKECGCDLPKGAKSMPTS